MGWCWLSNEHTEEGDETTCGEGIEEFDGEFICAGAECEFYSPGNPPDRDDMPDEWDAFNEKEAS
jgi:hypothetical protein